MLNSQQILDEGLLKLELTKGKPAQVGYDLSLAKVNYIGTLGKSMVDINQKTARIGPVMRNSPGLNPSRFIIGTVPPMIAGNCT